MADIPKCKNKGCRESRTVLAGETETAWVFACHTCHGIEVRTKPEGWAAGRQQTQYRRYGRPEYAKTKAFFFQGRNR